MRYVKRYEAFYVDTNNCAGNETVDIFNTSYNMFLVSCDIYNNVSQPQYAELDLLIWNC